MGQYWNRKGDYEDEDEKLTKPFAEFVGHGNMEFPRKRDNDGDGRQENDAANKKED